MKKEKLYQSNLQNNNLNLNIDDVIKLALRLIIATGGANEAKIAIDSAHNLINIY
ncbi:MAG: hypothetical protein K2P99_04335 [Burkholderiales bacterium]|nr:hypothetical protein [Burkholderiales bacterium]